MNNAPNIKAELQSGDDAPASSVAASSAPASDVLASSAPASDVLASNEAVLNMPASGVATPSVPASSEAASNKADSGEATLSELVEVLRQRSATYMLLSRLYRQEIDQALLDELHARVYPADEADSDLYMGYLYIATYLSNLWSGSLDELKIDFTRCFLGHGVDGYSAAYPYESVYTSPKRLMMQAARDEVLAIYRAYGVEKTSDWKEGEDHISLELAFERVLCDKTIGACQDGATERARELLAAQFGFLENHLTLWVPMLVADMKGFAQTKMYLGLAYLTEGFLRTDYHFLKELLSGSEDAPAGTAANVSADAQESERR